MKNKIYEDDNLSKIEAFEKYTKQYDSWFDENSYIYKSEVLAIMELLDVNKNGVEIGVGSGRFSLPLGVKHGVEPSNKMRKLAMERGIEVIKGVAERLPYPDNLFDYALMIMTICFLDDISKAFNEVYRILKHNGFFIIGFIDKESPIGKIYQENKVNNPFYKNANFYSVNEVLYYLTNSEFKNFSFRQTIFNPLEKIKGIEPIEKGYGRGSFVVIKANK